MPPEIEQPEIVETPAPEAAPAAPEAPQAPAAEAAAPEAPAYTPNYKLKVMQEEKEIPESFRSLMKDEKSEKEVREIFEKAYGLDYAKPKHEATQTAFTRLQAEHHQLQGSIKEASDYYQRGDIDSFLERLAIPQERMLQWAIQKAQYLELSPEQRAQIDAQRDSQRRVYTTEQQLQQTQNQYQEQVRQARQYALNSELGRPETKSIVEAFDARMGRPGSFAQEVINHGLLTWQQSQGKVDLTPSQAIEQVVQRFGLRQVQPASHGQSQSPAQQGGGGNKTATIPNMGGGKSAAPVKKLPRSLDDLRAMRDAMS